MVLAGCSQARINSPRLFDSLEDCTAEFAAFNGELPPAVPDTLRRHTLSAATQWAREACYLPCDYEMCAAITKLEGDQISVYVTTPRLWKEDGVLIAPECELTLSATSMRELDAVCWHSPCGRAQEACPDHSDPPPNLSLQRTSPGLSPGFGR